MAGEAKLVGTTRWLEPELGSILKQSIKEIVDGVALQTGCDINWRFEEGLPAVINDQAATEIVRSGALKIVDRTDLFTPEPLMYSEDMAFYLNEVPGCFAFVGAAPTNAEVYPHHHPRFDICEDALGIAAALIAQIGFDGGWKLT